jgi:hypothetical protein
MVTELCTFSIFQDGQKALYSLARVKTKLKQGAQAKVTLEATAPGVTGQHSKAVIQVSGPSTSKVVVSATGALNKKHRGEGRASGGKNKGATSSALLLRGPSP